MAQAGAPYSSVYVVDKEMLTHQPGHAAQTRRTRLIQNTLFVLVCVVLCAVVLEAFFIYNLHRKVSKSEEELHQNEADKGALWELRKETSAVLTPSKPLAHLKDATDRPDDGVLQWDKRFDSILHQLEYREGKLVVQKEGFYYIYSKISFSPDDIFIHTVKKSTPRYAGKPIDLMRDRRYPQNPAQKVSLQNSFLGGVFHLHKNDVIFVHVNKGLLVRLQISADNYFGVFML